MSYAQIDSLDPALFFYEPDQSFYDTVKSNAENKTVQVMVHVSLPEPCGYRSTVYKEDRPDGEAVVLQKLTVTFARWVAHREWLELEATNKLAQQSEMKAVTARLVLGEGLR